MPVPPGQHHGIGIQLVHHAVRHLDAGVGVAHKRGQTLQAEEKFYVACGVQMLCKLCFAGQEGLLRRVGKKIRMSVFQRLIKHGQVLPPVIHCGCARSGRLNTHAECQDRRQRQSAGSLNELGSLLQMKSAPLDVLLR